MSLKAEVVMSDGTSYRLEKTPAEIYDKVTDYDGNVKGQIHPFETSRGETIYLHTTHIVAILEYQTVASHEELVDKDSSLK